MIAVVALLEGLAIWLRDEGLAQYRADGSYSDDPTKPAVVFADSDVPDTLLLLAIAADNRFASGTGSGSPTGGSGGLAGVPPRVDVQFAYRSPGKDARSVEGLAEAVLARIADLAASGPLDRNGINTPPVIFSVGSVDVGADNLRLVERGLPEMAPKGKYAGDRFQRVDTYRVGIW